MGETEKERVEWSRLKAWCLIIQREASGLARMQQVAAAKPPRSQRESKAPSETFPRPRLRGEIESDEAVWIHVEKLGHHSGETAQEEPAGEKQD